MLGDQIGEERGQVTTMRVLSAAGHEPRVEVSSQAAGTDLSASGFIMRGRLVGVTCPTT
jgi:hypothetical protein